MAELTREQLEAVVLGYVSSSIENLLEVRERLSSECFQGAAEKSLYEDYLQYFSTSKKLATANVSILMLQERKAKQEHINARKLLVKSLQVNDDAELDFYINTLRDRHISDLYKEGLKDAALSLKVNEIAKVKDKLTDTLTSIEGFIIDRSREGVIRESTENIWEEYTAVEADPFLAQGVPTGFPTFDARTMGLQKGELLIINGDTGSGKSILCTQIGVNAFKSGKNVAFLSLEVDKRKVERRFISSYGYLPYSNIKRGQLSEADKVKFKEVLEEIKQAKNDFYIVDVPRNCTPLLVESKLRKALDKYGLDLLIIDYLGLMQPSSSTSSDEQAQARISEDIHELARIYKIPIIAPVQATSKRYKSTAKEKGAHRISRAERIAHNADMIAQIDVIEDEDTSDLEAVRGEDESIMYLHFVKMRDEDRMVLTLRKNFARMMIVEDTVSESIEEDIDFE